MKLQPRFDALSLYRSGMTGEEYTQLQAQTDAVFQREFDCIEILADDGKRLFSFRLTDDGALEVESHSSCRHGGVLLSEDMTIQPVTYSRIRVRREVTP